MGKIISKVFENRKSRTASVMVLGVLFILAAFLFVGNELIQNKAYLLRQKKEEQQMLTDAMASYIGASVDGASSYDIVNELSKSPINGSYRWCFLAEKNRMIQVRDKNYYKAMTEQNISTLKEFLKTLPKEQYLVTTQTFETSYGIKYTFGIATRIDSIFLDYKVTKHNTYLFMALAFVCMAFFCSLVFVTMQLANRDKKLARLNEELEKRQKSLEDISEEVTWDGEAALQNSSNNKDYEDELAYQLLKKSGQEALFPMGLIYMKCYPGQRYITKAQFFHAQELLKKQLTESDILLEIAKGEFLVFSYQIKQEAFETLRTSLEQVLSTYLVELKIYAHTEASYFEKTLYQEQGLLEHAFLQMKKSLTDRKDAEDEAAF